jgi:5-methyltetrahydropteroyltriglutamate--homocysteine methyltransferase
LGKIQGKDFDRYRLFSDLVEVYLEVLKCLASAQAEWVQFDEPALALDLTATERSLLLKVYSQLAAAAPTLKFLVATYFNALGENLSTFAQLAVDALHVDATQSKGELKGLIPSLGPDKILSLGVVSGRNIWRNDYRQSLETINQAVSFLGNKRLLLAPSCSLLHVPFSLRFEQNLNSEIKSWLAFAEEKLVELVELRRAYEGETELVAKNRILLEARATSALIHRPGIKSRSEKIGVSDIKRRSPYSQRNQAQREHLRLPDLPTTTIGSFPQTEDVRATRAHYRKGKITQAAYEAFLEKEMSRVIRWQDEIGLDVLVHGEFERTDMVEYFGEQLSGFIFTENGWVQSYGSRCVKPPILFGDVERTSPMTVRWAKFAQAQTKKPMKGMLTTAGVTDRTQIHTHMCYSEFNEIIEAIAELDADVISIESSRSEMELLEAFRTFKYPNEVGPGLYDIHSPRVPSVEEMIGLLKKALQVLPRKQVWVNPDCGLKTRGWSEVQESLTNMVIAARKTRTAD